MLVRCCHLPAYLHSGFLFYKAQHEINSSFDWLRTLIAVNPAAPGKVTALFPRNSSLTIQPDASTLAVTQCLLELFCISFRNGLIMKLSCILHRTRKENTSLNTGHVNEKSLMEICL